MLFEIIISVVRKPPRRLVSKKTPDIISILQFQESLTLTPVALFLHSIVSGKRLVMHRSNLPVIVKG